MMLLLKFVLFAALKNVLGPSIQNFWIVKKRVKLKGF